MARMEELKSLQERITHLVKHIESQDLEVYRQQRLIDTFSKQVNKLEERIDPLEHGGAATGSAADERPPHY